MTAVTLVSGLKVSFEMGKPSPKFRDQARHCFGGEHHARFDPALRIKCANRKPRSTGAIVDDEITEFEILRPQLDNLHANLLEFLTLLVWHAVASLESRSA